MGNNPDSTTALVPAAARPMPARLNNSQRRSLSARADRPVPHWGMGEAMRIVQAAREQGRGDKGERDALMIRTMMDAALRVSETLGLRPRDVVQTETGYLVRVVGKAGFREAAISGSTAAQLHSYAYRRGLLPEETFFPIKRVRAWQILAGAAAAAGVAKPQGVGHVHIMRHTGAIERLRSTGNPKSVQDQLGHATPEMTLRYMKTLTRTESLAIQQQVNMPW